MHHSTQENSSVLLEMIQQVTENGESGMLEAMRVLLNEAMKVERSNSLEADPYERNESRLGYANGYKNKTVNFGVSGKCPDLNLFSPAISGFLNENLRQ